MPHPPWWCLRCIACQGLGRSPGTGGRLPSAPDASAGELGLVVQAWPVRAPTVSGEVLTTRTHPTHLGDRSSGGR